MIKIIADSTCDLSPELIEKFDLSIIPLHIVLDDKEYLDGVNITPDEIYRWSDENKTTPKTSAASFEDVKTAYEKALETHDEIIAICISEHLSTTGNVMRLVAEEMEIADKVTVISSENLSTGVGLLVLAAADLAGMGKTRSEIAARIQELIPNVRSSFVVDTLTYLHRGGRCGAVAALAGGVLKLRPMIAVTDGKMGVGKKYRGKMPAVLNSYAKDIEANLKDAHHRRIFVTHSGCEQEIIDQIYEMIKSTGLFDEVLITRAGGVISSHCGPGTLGILYIAK